MECACQKHKGYEVLTPGMTVDVYVQQDNGDYKFEGKAKLIEKIVTWYTPEPFPIVEHCPICKQTTNNIRDKWSVQLLNSSYTCSRFIHKFHSYGTPHVRDEVDENSFCDEEE